MIRTTGRSAGQPEGISLADAFYLHTAAPARLVGGQWLGGLFPGARADVAILADDPVRCDIGRLPELPVKGTVHAGLVVEH